MIDLAQHSERGPVLRQDIAERQDLSLAYLAQLFRHLKDAGLVEGVKGPGGGYRLGRDLATLTAVDVIQAVEGPFAVAHCLLYGPDGKSLCNRVDGCAARLLWEQLSVTSAEFLVSVTLKHLGDQQPQSCPAAEPCLKPGD